MIRFTMPSKDLTKEEKIKELNVQFDSFLTSPALSGIIEILKDSTTVKPKVIKNFFFSFDARRRSNGTSVERQSIKTPEELKQIFESNREALYDFFTELGLLSINKPLISQPRHLLILGASYNACYNRTLGARRLIDTDEIDTSKLQDISALGTYRIIAPVETKTPVFISSRETEFGVLSDCFTDIFNLKDYQDTFKGGLNTNEISCIRKFDFSDKTLYRVYSAPSSEPNRRANSEDTYTQYITDNKLKEDDSCLLITNNVYCNYQFIPFALKLLNDDLNIDFDIIGCSNDQAITKADEFDPNSYLQVVISIIDWIYRFKEAF